MFAVRSRYSLIALVAALGAPFAHAADKPTPPLEIAVPEAQPAKVDGRDLKKTSADELLARANLAMNQGEYTQASAYQYWYVQKAKTGQYNLACFLARIDKVDAAFYWLQKAGIDEGVDTEHALVDEDLVSLRRDDRWRKVQKYLEECNRFFETAPIGRVELILPKGYRKSTPIPAVVWMHGLGSNPENFVDKLAQPYADELQVALIGVSGTKPRGPRSYVWAEDVEKDSKRILDALKEVGDRVTLKKGCVITLGFSQGAQMGLEVAVSHPEEFAGSIVLSPGAQPHLSQIKPSPLLAKRAFVVSCGADEHSGNVRLTDLAAKWLRRAKAKVVHKPYPGVSAHSFPRDFDERFPEWVRMILETKEKAEAK